MKIEPTSAPKVNSSQPDGLAPVEKSKVQRAQTGSPESAARKDHATLSEKAQLLSKASTSFENTPEVRDEKVAALQKQIMDGKYQINYDELAKRLSSIPGLM